MIATLSSSSSSGSIRFRANRFRHAEEMLLPPPLPLINLPEETRQARTGLTTRPTHLPVRKHIHMAANVHEPNLQENRLLVDSTAEMEESVAIQSTLHVYEYNQPEITEQANAPSDTLVFDSLFECGNLQSAHRIFRTSDQLTQEYELLVHPDIKNSAYRQWFYFQVQNGRPGVEYKFSLINLAKSGALFGHGLQPVVYSEKNAALHQIAWVHRGFHVRYDVSTSPNSPAGSNTLSFKYEFEHEDDTVYFACLQPYSYTDLAEYLEALEHDPERSLTFRRTELCQTIAQNACDLLSITSPSKEGIPHEERRVIVLSARVHPGEPNSSWMMKGMLDYLTGPSSGAVVLRNHFIFKVVPMLNPDGVINGNTRVSLAGWDLNRKWSNPVEKLFPTVFHLKKLIATFQARDRVAVYCDLHGHSISRNIFTYGCYNKKTKTKQRDGATFSGSSSSLRRTASVKNDPRVFPMIVAKHSDFFSFGSCDFKVHKSKLNTARVVVNHELGVINSYTLEASFCGPDFGPRKDTQFTTLDLEEMGRTWCQSLLIYFDLVAQVKTHDAQRDEAMKTLVLQPLTIEPLTDRSEYLELTNDLLSDCEAAISELFHLGQLDNEDDNDDGNGGGCSSMGSDLSDAEDAPIPPNNGPEDDIQVQEPIVPLLIRRDGGYNSAPEEYSMGTEHPVMKKVKRKVSKRKHKKKKKNKHKVLLETNETTPMPPPDHIRKFAKRLFPKNRKKLRRKSLIKKLVDDDVEGEQQRAGASTTPRESVVLPHMPNSAGRRLRTAPSTSRSPDDKTKPSHGDEPPVLLDPTPVPPSKPRLVKIGSGVPLELPLVKPVVVRTPSLRRKTSNEESLEKQVEHDTCSSESDVEDEEDQEEEDSDSSERSQPESCVSEF